MNPALGRDSSSDIPPRHCCSYTSNQLKHLVNVARNMGIRIMPEYGSPPRLVFVVQ